jgi:NAD(P)-dependent dehydrogenase (short-subunit alcohol dehydrogenase family)
MSVPLRRWKRDRKGTFRIQIKHLKHPHLNAYNISIVSGLALEQALLAHNAKVYIAARSQKKAEEAIKELKEETGKEGIFLKLDLSDLKAVKAAAEEFQRCVYLTAAFLLCLMFIFKNSKEKTLHVLFNNAYAIHPCYKDEVLTRGL